MNDIYIQVDTKTAKTECENRKIGVKHANLQNKLIFKMTEKIIGNAWLEYEINGDKNYAEMEEIEDGYQIIIKSCLLISDYVNVDLKITETENANGIPVFISTKEKLEVYDSINASKEEPEYYPDWKTVADSKIAEMNELKEEIEDAIEETNNLNIDVSDKVNKEVNITLTKKDNTTKRVTLKDGTSLMFNWDGTRLGIKTDEDEEYTYVDLIGRTGPMGPQGEAFQVKKTYANINLMIADYDNMQINDYVMIDGNIEQEDNAKLFVKQEIEDPTYRWHYLADFSGATGIQGPTGLTPNIQIGTVTSGNTPSVSRTGTNENPILNFVLQQGPQGEIGPTGETGETGNGILNIVKLSSIDNIDTYQINMTDGTYYQFTVTNSNVTNQEFDDLKNSYDSLIKTLPKVAGSGENIKLDNTSEYHMECNLNPTELSQDGTPTPTNPIDVNVITGSNNIKIESKNLLNFTFTDTVTRNGITFTKNNDGSLTLNGTATTTFSQVFNITHQVLNGTYTIKHNVLGGTTSANSYLSIQKSTSGNISDRVYGETTSSTLNITEDTTIVTASIYIPTGTVFTDYNVGSQLEKGSTATNYVKHQEQNYPITLSSENLFDFSKASISRLGNNGTVTVEDDKIIFSATSSDVFGIKIDLAGLNLKNNTSYTVANLFTNTDTNKNPSGWRYYNGSTYTVMNNYRNYFTFTTSESGINQLLYYVGSPVTYNGTLTIYDIQLLEGTILQADVPNYAPYIANPLEYCKIGDYADQIFKNTTDSEFYDSTLIENEWYLKKNINKVIFNGNESWSLTARDGYYAYWKFNYTVGNNVLDKAHKKYCDKFIYNSNSYAEAPVPSICENSGRAMFIFKTSGSQGTTVSEWQSWLSSNNLIVYYVQATPTYIHISETDYPILRSQLENLYNNAKSYKGQTNITQTNDGLPFNIELSALRDLSTL